MTTWLFFSLLGVGTGAMYAALAIGLILVYRGSGVVNFAVGAMAMLPAMVYAELRSTGRLVIPSWLYRAALISVNRWVSFRRRWWPRRSV